MFVKLQKFFQSCSFINFAIKPKFSSVLEIWMMVRFALNVCKVVTCVLINVFWCGKIYVVGIGNQNTMVELIKNLSLILTCLEMQRNHDFLRGLHNWKKNQNKSSIGNLHNFTISENRILNLLLHKLLD